MNIRVIETEMQKLVAKDTVKKRKRERERRDNVSISSFASSSLFIRHRRSLFQLCRPLRDWPIRDESLGPDFGGPVCLSFFCCCCCCCSCCCRRRFCRRRRRRRRRRLLRCHLRELHLSPSITEPAPRRQRHANGPGQRDEGAKPAKAGRAAEDDREKVLWRRRWDHFFFFF